MPLPMINSDLVTLFDGLVGRSVTEGRGAAPALIDDGHVATYEGLSLLVRSCAEQLADRGIGHGDRVMMLLRNSTESVIGLLATTSLGAIAVPVIADAGPDRVAYVIENTAPSCCLVADGARVAATDIGRPTLRMGLDRTRMTATLSGVGAGSVVGQCQSESSTPTATSSESRSTAVSPDDAAVVLFSSGTTGRPKGVLLTHRQLLATARTLADVFGIGPEHRELIVCPMCHSGGWQRVAATLWAGGRVVIPSGLLSVTAILEDVRRHGITGLFSPPPLLRYFLRASPAKVRSETAGMRSIEIGSASLAADELSALAGLFPTARVFYHYGLTECSRAFILDACAHPGKRHTVGTASPGVEAAVCDDHGNRLPAGQAGQIWLRGNRRADRYWNRPDLDRDCFRDGWLTTGDYGALDEDGFLTLRGRKDDMITSAGHHFFPAEVETELGPIDDVVQYVVAGISDPKGILGQVPWAFVVPADPETWSPQQFFRAARTRLAAHLVPRGVAVVPSIPLTPSGKPDRKRAIALFASPASQES